jgi:hypothetical protein
MRSMPGQRSVASAQRPRTQEQDEKKGKGPSPFPFFEHVRTAIAWPSASERVADTDVEEVGVVHFFVAGVTVRV